MRGRRRLTKPARAGYPTHRPATGKTWSGSARISATWSTLLRITLIGQQPSPADFGRENEGLQRQGGIDRGVEEALERAVGDGLAAKLPDALETARVAEKDEEHRRGADPGHRREQLADAGALAGVEHAQDGRLLEVGLGGRAERRGAEQLEQGIGRHGVRVGTHRLAAEHLPDEGNLREPIVARAAVVAKPLTQLFRVGTHLGHPSVGRSHANSRMQCAKRAKIGRREYHARAVSDPASAQSPIPR